MKSLNLIAMAFFMLIFTACSSKNDAFKHPHLYAGKDFIGFSFKQRGEAKITQAPSDKARIYAVKAAQDLVDADKNKNYFINIGTKIERDKSVTRTFHYFGKYSDEIFYVDIVPNGKQLWLRTDYVEYDSSETDEEIAFTPRAGETYCVVMKYAKKGKFGGSDVALAFLSPQLSSQLSNMKYRYGNTDSLTFVPLDICQIVMDEFVAEKQAQKEKEREKAESKNAKNKSDNTRQEPQKSQYEEMYGN